MITGESALFEPRRDQNNAALFIAIAIASLTHVVLISIVSFPSDTDTGSPVSIEVLLHTIQETRQRLPAGQLNQQKDENVASPDERHAINKEQQKNLKPETSSDGLESGSKTLIEHAQSPGPAGLSSEFPQDLSLQKLESQIQDVVEKMTNQPPGSPAQQSATAPVSFSVADFPSRDQPEVASSWTDQLDLNPKRLVAGKINGMLAYRIKDMFGNIRCLAQRGNPADPSSWLWHRVPARSCEGLK